MNALVPQQAGELTAGFSSPSLYSNFIHYVDASAKTVETYTRALRQFAKYLADNGITEPNPDTITEYRDSLKAAGKAPATVQIYMTVVRLFFRYLEREGIYMDIAEHVKGAKVDRSHKKDALTASQAREVLDTSRKSVEESEAGLRDYAIVMLTLATGMRTIEVVRANVEDMRNRGGKTVIYIQGKGHEDRADWADVPPEVEKVIRSYLTSRHCTDPKAPLFVSVARRDYGQRMTTRSISRVIKNAMKSAGYDSPRLTAHSTRHTAVTLALLAGIEPRKVKDFARHVSEATTLIYAHDLSAEESRDECSEAVAQALFR